MDAEDRLVGIIKGFWEETTAEIKREKDVAKRIKLISEIGLDKRHTHCCMKDDIAHELKRVAEAGEFPIEDLDSSFEFYERLGLLEKAGNANCKPTKEGEDLYNQLRREGFYDER